MAQQCLMDHIYVINITHRLKSHDLHKSYWFEHNIVDNDFQNLVCQTVDSIKEKYIEMDHHNFSKVFAQEMGSKGFEYLGSRLSNDMTPSGRTALFCSEDGHPEELKHFVYNPKRAICIDSLVY